MLPGCAGQHGHEEPRGARAVTEGREANGDGAEVSGYHFFFFFSGNGDGRGLVDYCNVRGINYVPRLCFLLDSG